MRKMHHFLVEESNDPKLHAKYQSYSCRTIVRTTFVLLVASLIISIAFNAIFYNKYLQIKDFESIQDFNQSIQKQFGKLSIMTHQQDSNEFEGNASKQVSNLSITINKPEEISNLQQQTLNELQNNFSVQLQQQKNECRELIQQIHQQQLYNYSQISEKLQNLENEKLELKNQLKMQKHKTIPYEAAITLLKTRVESLRNKSNHLETITSEIQSKMVEQSNNSIIISDVDLLKSSFEILRNKTNKLENDNQRYWLQQESMKNKTGRLAEGVIDLGDGWLTPLNGYQYKFVSKQKSWQNARILCQTMGADLASYGYQAMATRRILFNAFQINQSYWVGLNDVNVENDWQWIAHNSHNGAFEAINETVFWHPGQPNHAPADCGYTFYHDRYLTLSGIKQYYTSLMMYDRVCSTLYASLCEKRVHL